MKRILIAMAMTGLTGVAYAGGGALADLLAGAPEQNGVPVAPRPALSPDQVNEYLFNQQ